jgi:hypothetical protein
MTGHFRYKVYGLALRSNQPLPAPQADDDAPVDVDIDIARAPVPTLDWGGSEPIYRGTESLWRLDEETWRLGFTDHRSGARWDITCERGSQITVRWMEGISLPDVGTLLVNSGLAMALHLRGIPCLHASGVVVNKRAALLLGPSGAGKSTTAAALMAAGNALLTDDIAALDLEPQRVLVHPGLRRLRLLADSAGAVNGRFDVLQPVWVDPEMTRKRYLDPATATAAAGTTSRLAVIYALTPRRVGPHQPAITALAPREALGHLLACTYASGWLDAGRRARLFRCLARVTELVPVRRVDRVDALDDLPRLARLLSADADLIAAPCPSR